MSRLSHRLARVMGVTLAGVSAVCFAVTTPAAHVANLRLVPLDLIALELGGTISNSALDAVVGRTRGFVLQPQAGGAVLMRAEGEPFQSVMGGTSAALAFDAGVQGWQVRTEMGSLQIRLNASLQDPASQRTLSWSGVTLCRTGVQNCSIFLLATQDQVCGLLASGNFKAEPARRQQALQALNAINAQAITCASP